MNDHAHILLNFLPCCGTTRSARHSPATLNLRMMALAVSRATAGRLDDNIQLLDRLL